MEYFFLLLVYFFFGDFGDMVIEENGQNVNEIFDFSGFYGDNDQRVFDFFLKSVVICGVILEINLEKLEIYECGYYRNGSYCNKIYYL